MRPAPRIVLAILAALVVLYAGLALRASPRTPHAFYNDLEAPVIIAHQGGDGLWPSNTLFAFERARELGVDVLEMDIHASRDDVLVVIHDDTVDRTTDGRGAVAELSLEELRTLDAGYHWSPGGNGASFPYRGQGLLIPTLEEVLLRFNDMPLVIEIKPDSAAVAVALCERLREAGKAESALVGSFHGRALAAFRAACPDVATSASPGEVQAFFVLNMLLLGAIWQPSMEALQVPEFQDGLRVVTRRFVAGARRKNVDVQVWTVNEADAMRRLLEFGAGGIISDRPDRLLLLLGRSGEFELPEGVPP